MEVDQNTNAAEAPIAVSTRVPADGTAEEPDESPIVPQTRSS